MEMKHTKSPRKCKWKVDGGVCLVYQKPQVLFQLCTSCFEKCTEGQLEFK